MERAFATKCYYGKGDGGAESIEESLEVYADNNENENNNAAVDAEVLTVVSYLAELSQNLQNGNPMRVVPHRGGYQKQVITDSSKLSGRIVLKRVALWVEETFVLLTS